MVHRYTSGQKTHMHKKKKKRRKKGKGRRRKKRRKKRLEEILVIPAPGAHWSTSLTYLMSSRPV